MAGRNCSKAHDGFQGLAPQNVVRDRTRDAVPAGVTCHMAAAMTPEPIMSLFRMASYRVRSPLVPDVDPATGVETHDPAPAQSPGAPSDP